MKKTDLVYKIRNKEGLFSTGGAYPGFHKEGKSWWNLSNLKSHLRLLESYSKRNPKRKIDIIYKDCEIVEYEKIERTTKSVIEYIKE